MRRRSSTRRQSAVWTTCINSRTAGVAVQTGTQTGTGSRVRIRGQNSLNLSNDPIYVIDGIRMTSDIGSNRYGTGGGNASRVGDINPEEIENIEVVKGPSAATLYGTDAANGVIVITTKKGRAGAPRWNVYGEGGYLDDRNTYPWNYTLAGHSPGSTAYRECTLPQVSAGSCAFDSLRVYAPAHDPDATPIGSGNRWQAGAQVSAGSDAIRYFVSRRARGGRSGTLELPDFERRRFKEQGIPLHDWTDRPNTLGKNSFRANVGAVVRPEARPRRVERVHQPESALHARVERDGRTGLAPVRRPGLQGQLQRSRDARRRRATAIARGRRGTRGRRRSSRA